MRGLGGGFPPSTAHRSCGHVGVGVGGGGVLHYPFGRHRGTVELLQGNLRQVQVLGGAAVAGAVGPLEVFLLSYGAAGAVRLLWLGAVLLLLEGVGRRAAAAAWNTEADGVMTARNN